MEEIRKFFLPLPLKMIQGLSSHKIKNNISNPQKFVNEKLGNKMDNDKLRKYLDGSLTPGEKAEAMVPPLPQEASELLLSCRPADYSASSIARAVEDCDAQLLGLSVTGMRDDLGLPVIALRVNVRDASGVARSLRRYGYDPFFIGSRPDTAMRRRAQERAAEIIHYLEM